MRRVFLFALLATTACAPKLRHDVARPVQLTVPDTWHAESAEGASFAARSLDVLFDDPELVGLIEDALAHNQELALIDAELHAAEAEWLGSQGAYLPEVGFGVGAGVEKVGRYTSQGASDASDEIVPGKEVPEVLGDFRVGLEASWEVDVWGRLRNASQAARHRYLASMDGRNFAVTQLVSEVAEAYYELEALDNQLEVLQTNIELQTHSLEVLRLQKEAARANELAVQRFEADLLKNRSLQYAIEQRIVQTEARINVLCGRYPQTVPRNPETFLEGGLPDVSLGTTADLLTNRPDIVAAEHRLEAARLDVRSARKAFYPSLGLDADLGLQSFDLKHLPMTPESVLAGVAGRLLTPLLNRKELRARYEVSNARQLGAVVDYERTVLTAYTEVMVQLNALRTSGERFELRKQQVDRLKQAIETSNGLFRSARADYLEVLTTRRDALESQMELVETRKDQLTALVATYKALGGGWRSPAGETR